VPKPSSATPIVLAYSGSATTTAAIPWLSEQRAADVVTVTLDLGQGQELEAVRDRAIAAGAVRAHVLDVREEFAREHVLPSLQAGATDAAGHPLIAALPIPLIARKLVDIASIEQARVVAHGSLGGEGVNPLQMAIQTLGPSLVTVVPPRPAASEGILANLWGRGVVVSEADGVRDGMAPGDAAEAAFVDVSFERGVPVGLNGVTLPLVDLITSLTTLARRHRIGHFVHHGPAAVRWTCEAPAAVALHLAHRELQSTVTPPDLLAVYESLRLPYAGAVERGLWFTPLREALQAFVNNVEERVTGSVRLRLFSGSCEVVNRTSAREPADSAPVSGALVHH